MVFLRRGGLSVGSYVSDQTGACADEGKQDDRCRARKRGGLVQSEQGPRRLLFLFDLFAWERFARTVASAAQALVVFTERDKHELQRLSVSANIARIPLGTVIPEYPLDPAGHAPPTILFVGNYAHPPNADAAMRLIRRIFPCIRMRRMHTRCAT